MAHEDARVDLNLGSNRLYGLPTPTQPDDAAPKSYVDASINGHDWKDAARVALTTNVSINSPGATLDGIAMAAGDRVLLAGQSTGSQNGIYVWNGAAVAMTRATDADANAEVTSGMSVPIAQGTYGGTYFILTTSDVITVGTTALTFSNLRGATLAKVSGTLGDGATTVFTVNDNLGTVYKHQTLFDISTGDEIIARKSRTTNTSVFEFNTAPATGSIGYVIIG